MIPCLVKSAMRSTFLTLPGSAPSAAFFANLVAMMFQRTVAPTIDDVCLMGISQDHLFVPAIAAQQDAAVTSDG
jgi:hypothetical protein